MPTHREAARAKLAALAGSDERAERVAERVGQAIGIAGSETAPEETLWAIRMLLERLAAERPLVFVIDDLQWAEPKFLELVEHVADFARDAPILLACMARPELLDDHPGWAGGKLNATSMLWNLSVPRSADARREPPRGRHAWTKRSARGSPRPPMDIRSTRRRSPGSSSMRVVSC